MKKPRRSGAMDFTNPETTGPIGASLHQRTDKAAGLTFLTYPRPARSSYPTPAFFKEVAFPPHKALLNVQPTDNPAKGYEGAYPFFRAAFH